MRDLQSYVDEEYRKAPEEAMRLYDGKTIEEAFPHVLKSQLKSRLNQLEDGRQAMLHERSGFITYIQKWTYIMWKEGLDQLEQFIALYLDWGTKLINEFKTKGDPERKHLFPALIQNHSRACLMSEEILHLLKGGTECLVISDQRRGRSATNWITNCRQPGLDACVGALPQQ